MIVGLFLTFYTRVNKMFQPPAQNLSEEERKKIALLRLKKFDHTHTTKKNTTLSNNKNDKHYETVAKDWLS
jgi:hypothetical protein